VSVATAVFWLLSALAVTGALVAALSREVMRMALGLGVLLLATAGFFAYYGLGFLAVAELFLYVGGVLVLILFAIMLVHRGEGGSPVVERRDEPVMALSSLSLVLLVFAMLVPLARNLNHTPSPALSPETLAAVLLGARLPQFELVGVLLLAALVAVVFVMGGDRE
jgi:NADH-quinone oxidoreductase subunit J